MFDFLLLLQIADIGMIQFPFCLHQLVLIVLTLGLSRLLYRMQCAFAALLRGVKGLKASILIFILRNLLVNFSRYRSFDDALCRFLGNGRHRIFLKAQPVQDRLFRCCGNNRLGCLCRFGRICLGCIRRFLLRPMLLAQSCFHAVALFSRLFHLKHRLFQSFDLQFFLGELQPGSCTNLGFFHSHPFFQRASVSAS